VKTPRRRAWRVFLSALTGGGLTAASLGGGPLTGGALAAETPSGTSTEGSTTPTTSTPTSTSTTSQPAGPQQSQASSSTPTPSGSSTPSPAASTPSTTQPTTSTPTPSAPAPQAKGPNVVVQRRQKTTPGKRPASHTRASTPANAHAPTKGGEAKKGAAKPKHAAGPSNVAPAPQLVAGQLEGLMALTGPGLTASAQALDFYRIPLFLLPIYQAAAIQYGVPWQVLAAINEIETNYGSDLSVSTAGAVGWMQFMPATWLQYGVDALNAGYADPYNPVDAIFAAARYLRAAGAAHDLHGAILAYNHSEEYVSSVLLRARLISSYPRAVIATLTGLVDGRPPVTDRRLRWGALSTASLSSATANAVAAPSSDTSGSRGGSSGTTAQPANAARSGAQAEGASTHASSAPGTSASAAGTPGAATPGAATPAAGAGTADAAGAATPGSSPAPSPRAAAGGVGASSEAPLLLNLISAPGAEVVAVQDGRILKLGSSHKLGKYVILRDVYGDVFTYAGLGSIAPTYRSPSPTHATKIPAALAASSHDPAPKQPATAGRQPLTLHVRTPAKKGEAAPTAGSQGAASAGGGEAVPAGMDRPRLLAHPGNPDARAAAAARAASSATHRAGRRLPLRKGSVVPKGTVLGHVRVPPGAQAGQLRFAIRPAGDLGTIDPRPVLENWRQLDTALHPRGAKGEAGLLGATANEVFLLSKAQLERAVLSDPGVDIDACGRHDIASGAIDKRVLAVLEFLSRSGLKPTVGALRCGHGAYTSTGYVSEHHSGAAVDIVAIDGIPIAGHQGPGTITDIAIRTLLTLQGEFVPHQIISLMRYPGAHNTLAKADHWDHIHIGFDPARTAAALRSGAAARAHPARAGSIAPAPLQVSEALTGEQWTKLITRIAALPAPHVAAKPSSAALPDPRPSKPGSGTPPAR
jgi:Transglycosylase SLT domain